MNPNFTPKVMTNEDRAKAAILKEQKKVYAKEHLKVEYMDAEYWRTLASKYDVRMPLWYFPATDMKYLKRMAKKTNVSVDQFVDSTGFSTLKGFVKANSTLSAFGLCGLYLEYVENIAPEIN